MRSYDRDSRHVGQMPVEMDRLKDTISTLSAELAQVARAGADWHFIGEEAKEPSFRRFVEDAFDISTGTTLESKRLLAGALIARRLEHNRLSLRMKRPVFARHTLLSI